MDLVRQKSARVVARTLLTHDSAEFVFAFEDETPLVYKAGQFVQVQIPQPKEDADWYVVNSRHVYDAVESGGVVSLNELISSFPCPHGYIEHLLEHLCTEGALKVSDGQYSVHDQGTAPEVRIKPFMRSYSLGSSPLEKHFSTMIKEVPDGFFSRYAVGLRRLDVGDEVLITGPLGHFALPDEGVDRVLLIGAGSGITPLMGIMKHIALSKRKIPTVLLYSNKTEEDIIYREELDQLSAEHKHLQVIHTLTRVADDAPWTGRRGRVDEELLSLFAAGEHSHIFICGPLHFGRAMKELLTTQCGVPQERIKLEAFG